jgi:hypothetical protein
VKSDEQRWVENWLETGPLLEAFRRDELRRLTPERALWVADAVLELAGQGWWDPAREASSGLVAQQALLSLARTR